ncbi:hypothetical protein PMAYCL1PPCAC_18386, partial [Pristionchus mayeri]
LKHREISSYLGAHSHPRWKSFSFITMLIGVWAALSLQISANFPAYKIKSIEGWANLSSNLSISVYITLHSILSLLVVDSSVPRKGILPIFLRHQPFLPSRNLPRSYLSRHGSPFLLSKSTQDTYGNW